MKVDDTEKTMIVMLKFNPVFESSKIIAKVEVTGGLGATEDSFHGLLT